jgi:hypothetical protein
MAAKASRTPTWRDVAVEERGQRHGGKRGGGPYWCNVDDVPVRAGRGCRTAAAVVSTMTINSNASGSEPGANTAKASGAVSANRHR